MPRLLPLLAVAFVASVLSTGAAVAGDDRADTSKSDGSSMKSLPTDVTGEVARAESLREQGKYADATHTLAQLMLVAPDDARVVGTYGKVLAQENRAQDAIAFLNRAVQLNPSEWTYLSALGVSYDEAGRPGDARRAYQQALALKPGKGGSGNPLMMPVW